MPTCIGVEQYILLRQYSGSESRINLENSAGDTMHSAKKYYIGLIIIHEYVTYYFNKESIVWKICCT